MEPKHGLDQLPSLPFRQILQFLPLEDVLNLSLVSWTVRQKIEDNSNVLFTYRFKEVDVAKLKSIAETKRKIKGISIWYLKSAGEERIDEWAECIDLLLKDHPELETFSLQNTSEKCLSYQNLQSLLCHPRMKSVELMSPCLYDTNSALLLPGLGYSKVLHSLKLIDVGLTHKDVCCILTELGTSLNILTLEMDNFSGEGLAMFTSTLIRLKELNIYSPRMSDKGLAEWMRVCRRSLKILDVSFAGELTDHALSLIFVSLPQLKSLCMKSTKFTGIKLKDHCKELQELDLGNCIHLTDQGLRQIVKFVPNLTTLIAYNARITGEGFISNQKLFSLKKLDLSCGASLDDEGLGDIIRQVPNLSILMLSNTRITGEGFSTFRMTINLEVLYLCNCKFLTDEGLGNIIRLAPKLTSLNLIRTRITGQGFVSDQKLLVLERLDLSCCPSFTDQGLRSIISLAPNLLTLMLDTTPITGAGFITDDELNSLKELNLTRCSNFTAEGVEAVRAVAPNISILSIPNHLA